MGEQPKTSLKQAEAAKLDAAAASAALALAVTSAEKSSAAKAGADRSKATRPGAAPTAFAGLHKARALAGRANRKHAVQASAVALALALGWAGGSQALSGGREALQTFPGWLEGIAGIRQNQEDIVRLAGDVNALKGIIEAFKDSFEQAKLDSAGQNPPFLERLETLERAGQDTTAKFVRVAEAADRIERAEAKLAAAVGRLDTIERRTAGADPGQTGSVPEAKSPAKPVPVEGWVLREVYDGGALVEDRNGRLHETAAGRTLPSVGRVEAIERRGKHWVVVTAKGTIGPPERWR